MSISSIQWSGDPELGTIELRPDKCDGQDCWMAYALRWPGLMAQGASTAEALYNVRDAYFTYRDVVLAAQPIGGD